MSRCAQLLNLVQLDSAQAANDDVDDEFKKLLLKLRMEEILDYDSFEKRMHSFLGAALDDVVHETNELTDQIAKLRELWPSAAGDDDGLEPNFALFFGYDPNDPELEQDPVTELDVFVDIALQVLRVVHLLANAEEALDSPLRPIRERIKLSKHELVQAYKKHCGDEEWTQYSGEDAPSTRGR